MTGEILATFVLTISKLRSARPDETTPLKILLGILWWTVFLRVPFRPTISDGWQKKSGYAPSPRHCDDTSAGSVKV